MIINYLNKFLKNLLNNFIPKIISYFKFPQNFVLQFFFSIDSNRFHYLKYILANKFFKHL
jgi:hypothetical protein